MNTVNNYTPIVTNKENTETLEKDYIHFTEPYYIIAGKEQFTNKELNEVLSHSIYANLQDNYDYIATTQYNTNKNNKYQVRKIERALDKLTERNRSLPLNTIDTYHSEEGYTTNSKKVLNNSELKNYLKKNPDLKTHNILNNNTDNIQIIHYIPSLNTQEIIQLEKLQNKNCINLKEDIMYNPRYNNNNNTNDYPPMNGLGYKNMLSNNADGYYTKTNHNQIPNPILQQQNIHGRNDLLFPEGSPPYGFYDQSNFAGTNTLMCGPNDLQNQRISRGQQNRIPENIYRNDYPPMAYGPSNMYPQQLNNNMNMNRFCQPNNMDMNMNNNMTQGPEPMYTHEVAYGQENLIQKSKGISNSVNGKDRKDLNRKNLSKLKKGMIDINIETSSSNRQGVCIDLNIGVGN